MKLKFTDAAQIAQSGITDIQLLRTATLYDHRYGEVTVTKEMLDQMVKNFDEKTRGIEIMLDAGHNSDKEAYGWFKSLEVRLGEGNQHELWAKVELTPMGQKALTEKLYGYISADFDMSYVDNETLKNHGTVLLGAALTNRPVVKRMKPAIELSEKQKMDLQQMLEACGVSSAEELVSLVSDLRAKADGAGSKETELSDVKMELSEKVKLLSEKETKLAEFEKAAELQKKENAFNALLSEGKACEAQRESFIKNDMVEFAKNAQPVKLSSDAGNGDEGNTEESAQMKIMKLAETKMKENKKLNVTSAIAAVLSENEELNKEYQNEMKGKK